MAKTTVLTSDLTGQPITKHALIRVSVDGNTYVVDADAGEEQIVALVAAGRQQKRRGRKKAA